jgi:hypothetical protein
MLVVFCFCFVLFCLFVLRPAQEFFTGFFYGDVTIAGERLQNLGLCSVLRTFEQEGIVIVPQCCDMGPWFFRSHPKNRPIQSPFATHKGC